MSDNDLIRRGDALRIMSDGDDIVGPDYPEWFINRYATINAIPAAQPTVSPDVAALVEAAFQEGFLAGTADGWTNNPRIKMEWKRSCSRAALARVKGEPK